MTTPEEYISMSGGEWLERQIAKAHGWDDTTVRHSQPDSDPEPRCPPDGWCGGEGTKPCPIHGESAEMWNAHNAWGYLMECGMDHRLLGYVLMCIRMKLRKDERQLERGKGGPHQSDRVERGRQANKLFRLLRRVAKQQEST